MRIVFLQLLVVVSFRIANCCVDERIATYSCNDCSNLRICGGGRDLTVSCGLGWYCDELQPDGAQRAACVNTVPSRCQKPEVTTTAQTPTMVATTEPADTTLSEATVSPPVTPGPLLCTGEGIYADPYNCAKYHYCLGYGETSWILDCPESQIFDIDSDTNHCKPKLQNQRDECPKVDCKTGGSLFKSYGTNGRFYTYCYEDKHTGSEVVAMFRCNSGAVFDGTRCIYTCTRKGLFANSLNSYSYYECYYLGEKLVYNVRMCPEGKKFFENLQVCV